jgi:hypothetical protein
MVLLLFVNLKYVVYIIHIISGNIWLLVNIYVDVLP